jgi:hypothetical protein
MLGWDEGLDRFAARISSESIHVILGRCTLRMPKIQALPSMNVDCAAVVTIGGDAGFHVSIQGAMKPAQQPYFWAAALSPESSKPFRLRGIDAEGGKWFINDLRLQTNCAMAAGAFQATMEPNYISVRGPKDDSDEPHIEVAIDAAVKLPRSGYQLEADQMEDMPEGTDTGRVEADDPDLAHTSVGRFRILSLVPAPRRAARHEVRDLCDAIAFVSGRRVDAELVRVTTAFGTSLHIHRRRPWPHPSLPPIEAAGQNGARDTWRVLHAYLQFARAAPARKRPTLSVHLAELHGAIAATYASSKALIAAVTVEGLVTDFIKAKPEFTPEETEEHRKQIAKLELPSRVVQHCQNQVANLGRVNTSRRLRVLIDAGVVDDDLVRIWNQGRHKLAHGNKSTGNEDIERYLAAVSLVHAIVLGLLGHRGAYKSRGLGGFKTLQSAPVPGELLVD